MSSDELRAAERLLANSWDVYGDRPTNDDDEWFALADKITADGAMLARAYRREHWPQAEQGERCPDCGATGGVHREGCSELPDESSKPTAEQPPDGVALIAAERKRQVEAEGFDAAHDDRHDFSELACAAVAYAIEATAVNRPTETIEKVVELVWPFDESWWKPSEDPIRNLEKAGAFCAAEIDRLQRLKAKETTNVQ